MAIPRSATKRRKDARIGVLPRSLTQSLKEEWLLAFTSLRDSLKPGTSAFFKAEYQVKSFLSKFTETDASSAEMRATAAIKKWLAVEYRNERTNFRVQFDEAVFSGDIGSEALLETARRYICKIIGTNPPEYLFELGQFTNGSSTGVSRGPQAISEKFVGKADVTPSAWPYFERLLEELPGWGKLASEFGLVPNFVESSVMFTVPKNSDIDRVACKEPEINMFLQRAVGNFFRLRLKRSGIDLNDQQINQDLARRGSHLRSHPDYMNLATIDLSSASDCVSQSLVWRLLPPSWCTLLEDIRVKTTILPSGEVHELNMFSSMGNGFTFELESLLFYALAKTVAYMYRVRGRISIYGDDIIVPVDVAPRLAKVLNWFGFKVNTEKSFWRTKFRESCGGHYYRGADVTPFYLRGPLKDQRDLINQLNQLRNWIVLESFHGLWTYEYTNGTLFSSLIDSYNRYSRRVWQVVHGGRDMEDNTALVTPTKPSKRMTSRTELEWTNQGGAFLQWLHQRDRISKDAVTSRVMSPRHLVLVTNRSERGMPVNWLFCEELPGWHSVPQTGDDDVKLGANAPN